MTAGAVFMASELHFRSNFVLKCLNESVTQSQRRKSQERRRQQSAQRRNDLTDDIRACKMMAFFTLNTLHCWTFLDNCHFNSLLNVAKLMMMMIMRGDEMF